MTKSDFPTDPNAETIGLPSDDSGKGSVPEPGKFVTSGMPTEIGRYKILGIIASGGMGVVYEAMQEAPRRRVALKIIKAGSASEMALHRFQFEAQTLAKLSHPNIAQIFEAGMWESENGEVPFFAMEYIPGAQGIVEYAQKRDLSIRDRLELFGKICDAVHHGHQKGIIHRDLKPENILVDNQGEPKIIDFGVARATDADLAVTTMQTTMGQLIGTLQYMSPEQCDADPDRIDTRSDVYALGVILFQILSGKLPYDLRRQAIHEAVRIIKEQRPDSLGTISTTLKGDIDTIALKAMEKDRERRYQSAAELARDIHHFLNNEPIIARPLSIGYQVKLFTKKYKRTCAAVLLLFVSIVLGIIGTTSGWIEANRQTELALEQRNIAEERYNEIIDFASEYTGGFYAGIVKLNAGLEVRKLVLDSTLRHLDKLAKSAGQTEQIRSLRGNTHRFYGSYFAGNSAANLGDVNNAILHYDKAISIYNELIDEGLSKYNYSISVVFYRLGELSRTAQDYPKSISHLEKASEKLSLYLDESPEDDKALRLDSLIDMSMVDTLVKVDINKASEVLQGLVEERKIRAEKSPSDFVAKRDYANILQREANMALKKGETDVAISTFKSARDIYSLLVELQPENGQAPRDLAWSEYFLGKSMIENGDAEQGLNRVEAGLYLVRDCCIASPNDARPRQNVLLYTNLYFELCSEMEQLERAEGVIRNLLASIQPVVEQNPNNYAIEELFSNLEIYLDTAEKNTALAE
ncbi:MAG: serine/threonine-protein kinase [Phycisphaerales bacterium]|jgi:serine/threonine protein kinase|nr:serine/threonine-protein kinase [Phycisphaerales bacterium]